MENEIFKPIPGLAGYFVSNFGRIRRGETRIVKTHIAFSGYVIVQITYDGKRRAIGVHRLVAQAFLGELSKGVEVDHLDFDKTNNYVENLEIVTRSENMRRFHSSEISKTTYQNISKGQKKSWDEGGRKIAVRPPGKPKEPKPPKLPKYDDNNAYAEMFGGNEIFKPIPDLPGYFISNEGRVRRGNTKILKPCQRKWGETVSIMCDKKRTSFTVSKMVKAVFGQ